MIICCLFNCLFVYLFICLFVYLFICLFVYLFVYLFVSFFLSLLLFFLLSLIPPSHRVDTYVLLSFFFPSLLVCLFVYLFVYLFVCFFLSFFVSFFPLSLRRLQRATMKPNWAHFVLSFFPQRQTLYERKNNVSCFSFETPFTQTGKAHGEIHEQWKR